DEEKRAVAAIVELGNIDRASCRAAKLVAIEERRLCEVVLPTARYTITTVAVRFEQGAVKLVRAALARENHRIGPAELRGRIARLHPKLLDGVESGSAPKVVSFPFLVNRRGVENGGVAVDAHPIGLNSPGCVRIAEFNARHGNQKRRKAAPVDGKLLD